MYRLELDVMKKGLILLVLAASLVGAGAAYWRRDRGSTLVFRTTKVQRGDVLVSISATGTIEPEEVIDVGAQVAGQIVSFGKDADGKTVDYGSIVEEGTVLARIDDSLYSSEVAQAEAQIICANGSLQRAEADLGQMKAKLYQAERDWERARQIGPSQALAASAYDGYKSAYDTAKANVLVGQAAIVQAKGSLAQSEAFLQRARRNLGYCTIKSPVKGVIIDRRVNIGQTVVASLNAPSLFLIAKDLTRIQVWVAVNEADIGRLKKGQPVSFTVDAFPGELFKGQVGKIRLNASMTQNVVTYTVEVIADNANGRLLPYLTASVKFELNRRTNVLTVPSTALQWTPAAEQISPHFRQGDHGQPTTTLASASASEATPGPAQTEGNGQGVVWVLDGEFVRPVRVRVGVTDDEVTEVEGEGLSEGLEIVTGQEEQQSTTDTGTSNPFTPKIPRGGKGGPPPPM
jgi:HlyD family secretion protein